MFNVIKRTIVPNLITRGLSKSLSSVEVSPAGSPNGIEIPPSPYFNDAQEVFGHRSTRELLRAYFVLHACSVESLVKRSYKLMRTGDRLLGTYLLSKVLSPFYNQFVAGDSEEQLREAAQVLSSVGVNLIICPLVETDIGEGEDRAQLFQRNFAKTVQLIEMANRHRPTKSNLRPICLTKITAHIHADHLKSVNAAYESLTPDERMKLVQAIGERMKKLKGGGSLSPSERIPFDTLNVPQDDVQAIEKSLPRLVILAQMSKDNNVVLAIDAEFTYVNSTISLLTLPLMIAFNDESPVIWNTYQAYLKSTNYWLRHDFDMMRSLGVAFGAKLVRGAYMEREREYAQKNNQKSPVHDTYEDTNASYDSLASFLLAHVASSPQLYNTIVATHNEASVRKALHKMKTLGIPNSTPSLVFGQTYGMAENISVPLAKAGYSVYKAVAYGNFGDVLPYLSRRVQENRGVLMGTRRERHLLGQELRRRFKLN